MAGGIVLFPATSGARDALILTSLGLQAAGGGLALFTLLRTRLAEGLGRVRDFAAALGLVAVLLYVGGLVASSVSSEARAVLGRGTWSDVLVLVIMGWRALAVLCRRKGGARCNAEHLGRLVLQLLLAALAVAFVVICLRAAVMMAPSWHELDRMSGGYLVHVGWFPVILWSGALLTVVGPWFLGILREVVFRLFGSNLAVAVVSLVLAVAGGILSGVAELVHWAS